MAKRILVVDDDKAFLEEFCESLRSNGYETTSVDNAVKFCAAVCLTHPDLILLDLKMPIKNGFELIASMDFFPELCHAPIMVMSGHYREEYASMLDICDVRGCLKKPFRVADVLPAIRAVLKEPAAV